MILKTPLHHNLKYKLSKLETPQKQKSLALHLKEHFVLTQTDVLLKKMCCNSGRIPLEEIHYYYRLGSILKKLIHNPCGVSKVASFYKTKSGNRVKPPRMKKMHNAVTRMMLKHLQNAGLVHQNEKGFYTVKKGKDLILNIYESSSNVETLDVQNTVN